MRLNISYLEVKVIVSPQKRANNQANNRVWEHHSKIKLSFLVLIISIDVTNIIQAIRIVKVEKWYLQP